MHTREQYISKLKGLEETLRRRFGIVHLVMFGSVSRDEQTPGSDIDLCVETKTANPFILMDLRDYLADFLGCTVDIVRRHTGMNPYLSYQIQKDGIQII